MKGNPGNRLERFIGEFRRRRVGRVTLTYAAVAWLLVEIATTTFPLLGLPERAASIVLVLLLLGFPVAVILAWVFDLTSGGIQKTKAIEDNGQEPSEAAQQHIQPAPASQMWMLLAAGAALGAAVMWWTARFEPVDDIRSIAVLPLANFSGNAEDAYFVDGMHGALISELGKLGQLTVLSRTSVQRYRDTKLPLQDVGEQLEVQGIIEGSVFRAGDTVRITVQLIRADPEKHLWSDSFEGPVEEALSLHRRVAGAVARQVSLTLKGEQNDRLSQVRQVDPEVQEAYLRGRYHLRNRAVDLTGLEEIDRAVLYLERAVALDDTFAPALAAMAEALTHRGTYGWEVGRVTRVEAEQDYRKGLAAARRAVELDAGLGEAYSALGNLLSYDTHWQESETALRKAVELNPSDSQSYIFLGDLFLMTGRADEAVSAYARGRSIDPLSVIPNSDLARGLLMAGRCDEALKYARDALDLDVDRRWGRTVIIECLAMMGQENAAAEEMERSLQRDNADPDFISGFRAAHAEEGFKAAMAWIADRPLEELDFMPSDPEMAFPGLDIELRATVLAYLGRNEEALTALELALERGNPFIELIVVLHPWMHVIRQEPRFQAVLRARGL